uniref:Capsid protein n=1 Tax=Syrmaticus ellioti CRESS-DNA-virus sp. TaxID=2815058 RepID=A0A8A4XCC2_9VIRU|nr:MAG: capsid protein [Syrmaticus ellioti CRESS-DNA-virus sp.]
MPYGRGYKRRYNRGRRWRYSRLIRNRSSIAQAGQIKALSRRISKLAKSSKSDTYTFYTPSNSRVFNNSAVNNISYTYSTFGAWETSGGQQLVVPSGVTIPIYNCKLFGVIEYADNYDNHVAIDHQRTCSMRIVVVQTKTSNSEDLDINDVLVYNSTGPAYELNTVRNLRDNVTSRVKVLADRTYMLSNQEPFKRINIDMRKLLPIRQSNETFHSGEITVLFVTSGLHWDTSYQQQLTASWGLKMAVPGKDLAKKTS